MQRTEKGKTASIFSACSHSLVKFLKTYLLKRGFLDGRQGLIISVLGSYYVFLKYAKHWERSRGTDREK
jgi:(heptosyl)LPS beta-1,4-glucosyltransferase